MNSISAEDFLAGQLEERHIPFVRQYKYAKGRNLKADFALLQYRLLIEVQGGIFPFARRRKDGSSTKERGAHGTVKGILADIDRGNEAACNFWLLLRFATHQVFQGEAITFIMRGLEQPT